MQEEEIPLNKSELGNLFLQELPDFVYVFDYINKKNTYSNNAIGNILGYSPEEFSSKPSGWIIEQIHPDDLETCMQYLNRLGKREITGITSIEYRLRHKDGSYRWIRSREIILDYDKDGNIKSLLGIAQDITDYKEQEEDLIRSRNFIESTINNVQEVIYSADENGLFTFISKRCSDLFEIEPSEVVRNPNFLDDLILEEDREKRKSVMKCLLSGGSCSVEFRVLLPSKSIKYIRESAIGKVDEGLGNVVRVDGSFQDITIQKEAEKQLSELNQLYEQALKATNDGIWRYEGDTGELFISDRWKEIFGYGSDELGSHIKVWREMIHPDDLETILNKTTEAVEKGQDRFEVLQRVKHKKGHWVQIISRAVIIRDENGNFKRMFGAITDITESKESERELLESRQLLEEAQNIAKIGTYELDLATLSTRFSPSYFAVAGITNPKDIEKIIANPREFERFIHPDDYTIAIDTMQTALRNLIDLSVEYRILSGQRLLYISSKAKLIRDESGKPVKYTGTIQDITERKMKEMELLFAKQEAEDASNAKSQFLSIMSHEIRTPLNAVIGMSYVLLREDPDPDQIENLKILKNSAEHLLDLVNNILDYNRIEAGSVSFDEEDFNISGFIDDLRRVWGPSASEKRLLLETSLDPSVPEWLRGDTSRLLQVMNNLISNAIKFTLQGGVIIGVKLLKELEDGVLLRISVKDSGIGIPPEKQANVFEVFSQVHKQSTRQFGGSGLGLAICSRLLEFQGSKLKLVSEVSKGSEFYFDLKFGHAYAPENLNSLNGNEVGSDLFGFKILVVEDNETNRQVIARFLKAWNCDYHFAHNGAHGIEMVISFQPDLVLMDIQMPVMDGYTASVGIRQLEGDYYKNLPIIALTASTLLETRDRITAAGINDFVEKPFNPDKLYKLLESYMLKKHD